MTPEALAARAGVPLGSVRSQIAAGRLREAEGIIPRSDCIRYLRELGLEVVADVQAAPAPPAGFSAGADQPDDRSPAVAYDPEDPEWVPGCERARLEWVCDQLARVVAPRVIIRELMAKGMSRGRAETYLRRAYDDLSVLGQIGAENRRDQYRDTLAEILHECMEVVDFYGREGQILSSGPRDLRTAARIVDQLIKLDGGYPAQKIRMEGNVGVEMTGSSSPQAIREKLAKYMDDPVLLARARGEELPVPDAQEPQGDNVAGEDQAG